MARFLVEMYDGVVISKYTVDNCSSIHEAVRRANAFSANDPDTHAHGKTKVETFSEVMDTFRENMLAGAIDYSTLKHERDYNYCMSVAVFVGKLAD
jgi:hypothetical protein